MILLDSSIIRAIGFPHDAALTMVRILAERTGHTVALPETVSHEYLSDRRSDLDKKRKAAQAGWPTCSARPPTGPAETDGPAWPTLTSTR